MPKLSASDVDLASVRRYLEGKGLGHLRARTRADLLVFETGAEDDPIPRARLRRSTVHLWTLEFATHTGKWEKTGFRGQRDELIDLMADTFPWTVAPLE
jgi:hypothetical protein